MTYSDGWKYWYTAWRGLEHGKSDDQMSADVENDHGSAKKCRRKSV